MFVLNLVFIKFYKRKLFERPNEMRSKVFSIRPRRNTTTPKGIRKTEHRGNKDFDSSEN